MVGDVLFVAEVVSFVVGCVSIHCRQGLYEGVTHVPLHPPGDVASLLTIHKGKKIICGGSVIEEDRA